MTLRPFAVRSATAGLTLALAAGLLLLPSTAHAGGSLEQIDITAGAPSPIPGHIIAPLVPIRWDERCVPIDYRINELDPIPNPLGPPVITQADATAAFQSAMDSWNSIRTSWIEMNIVGTVANPNPASFDFVREITFRTAPGFGAIAVSPSTSLISDVTFNDGDDVDGDRDSDVSSAITTCADVDGDGDIELPAGDYGAGTILDNDVRFNAAALRFTVDPAAADTVTNSVDLEGVAVHELGHSHGLSHVLDNLTNRTDGTGATMYPFIDTGDPVAELSARTLDEDDIATSSLFYPEGTASSGPAALSFGDLAFHWVYGTITGEVTDGATGFPVAGASVAAFGGLSDTNYVNAFSGSTQLSYDPATGGLFLVDPTFNITDGRYVLPVRLGVYDIGIEATDGNPVPASSVSLSAQIGGLFGLLSFDEEYWNGSHEAAVETSPLLSIPRVGVPSLEQTGVDFVTNLQSEIANFGNQNFVGFTGQAPGSLYAVRVPGAEFQAAYDTGLELLHGVKFNTFQSDASVPTVWAEALLAKGSVAPDGTATVDLDRPLRRARNFLAQDGDYTPFWFLGTRSLARNIDRKIDNGKIEDLFLVLRMDDGTPPGANAAPPLVGLDGNPGGANDAPIFGYSYLSTDGGATWTQVTNFNFMFSLVLSEAP